MVPRLLAVLALVGCNLDSTLPAAPDAPGPDAPPPAPALVQQAYIKASNTEMDDSFGIHALSADGKTLAVAAFGEASAASGVGGNQADNTKPGSGAVYVYVRDGESWSFQAYIKASNPDPGDLFGLSLALSADGNTLAVSASAERSGATTINGDQTDNSVFKAGAVYVFTRTGSTWAQHSYLKPPATAPDENFGLALALDASGELLAAGAPNEDGSSTGVGGDPLNDDLGDSGAVHLFRRIGDSWVHALYFKASNTNLGDRFGISLAMGADTLVVGADLEDSDATRVGGDQASNAAQESGAVYVFHRTIGFTYEQKAYIKASNTQAGDQFGTSVAVSADGTTLAVFAPDNSGVPGNEADNSAPDAGAVYVYTRTGFDWSHQATLKPSVIDAGDGFGASIALSADGDTLAIGSSGEDSTSIGLDGGDPISNGSLDSGAVYLFKRSGTTWTQDRYIKASNAASTDGFGNFVSLSADGRTFVAAANNEDSSATLVGGDQADGTARDSGAVYVFQDNR